jgi:hypothetical protein
VIPEAFIILRGKAVFSNGSLVGKAINDESIARL